MAHRRHAVYAADALRRVQGIAILRGAGWSTESSRDVPARYQCDVVVCRGFGCWTRNRVPAVETFVSVRRALACSSKILIAVIWPGNRYLYRRDIGSVTGGVVRRCATIDQ